MRKEEPEEESGYSWMDTYGDMVTLLLCFFVLLYSFSSVDASKWQELVSAFTGSAGNASMSSINEVSAREGAISKIDNMIDLQSRDNSSSDSLNAEQQQINTVFDELYKNIRSYIDQNDIGGQVSMLRTDDSITLRFSEISFFSSGKATIRPESKPILMKMVNMIYENYSAISVINVEGHTDNLPISTVEFADNWDLSVKRATNTLRFIIATGFFDEEKLTAVGYGEYHPIATNDTAEGRSLNRRVDIVLKKVITNQSGN